MLYEYNKTHTGFIYSEAGCKLHALWDDSIGDSVKKNCMNMGPVMSFR